MSMQMTSDAVHGSAHVTSAEAAQTVEPHAPEAASSDVLSLKADRKSLYMTVLTWLFVSFNSIRVASYLPTIWALCQSGQSDQYSLLTWVTWMGANATMACWLWEQNKRHVNMAILVQIGNALMCTVTVAVISWYRL